MSGGHDRDWDAWGAAWRRFPVPPARSLDRVLAGTKRHPGLAVRSAVSVAHAVILGGLAFGLGASGFVATAIRLGLMTALTWGATEMLRVAPWTRPGGRDPLRAHLDRALFDISAMRARLRGLAAALFLLALAGGPGTWLAWAALDGSSALPHLPPILPNTIMAAIAAGYGVVVARRLRAADREAARLEAFRALLVGESGDEMAGV